MKIYLVIHSIDWEGTSVVGVYANREDAELIASHLNHYSWGHEGWYVEEKEVVETL